MRRFIDAELQKMRGSDSSVRKTLRETGKEYFSDHPLGGSLDPTALNEHLTEAEAQLEQSSRLRRDIAVYERMRNAPYFGRVVFEDNDGERENIYVGLRSLHDLSTFTFYVYDWRAPISSLFYTGETGKASYPSPSGDIEGTISGIRQYKFGDGRLLAHWDADLRIDDSVLHEVLSTASGERLKTIVNTIQREQNLAIRFDSRKNLVVSGPAGCGKTSVGMHRLAWLLYETRSALLTPRLVMFTANEAFRSYVTGVLPELGEDEINFSSPAELFDRFIGGQTESQLKQTEALLDGDDFRRRNAAAVYDRDFLKYIENAMLRLPTRFRPVVYGGKEFISAEELQKRYDSFAPTLTPEKKLEFLSQWAVDEAENRICIRDTVFLREVEENLPDGEAQDIDEDVDMKYFLDKTEKNVRASVTTDPIALYRQFFTDYYGEGELTQALLERLGSRKLLFEDASAILCIGALTGRYAPSEITFHVLIDEAQDMSPLMLKAIRMLYPKAVFTLLADVNQAITPVLNTTDIAEIAGIYASDVMKLGKSFRSTKQISEFAKRYLDGADYEVFDRDGDEPRSVRAADHVRVAAGIAESLPEGTGTVCVILRTAKEAAAFGKAMREYLPECTAVTRPDQKITSRVTVMPVTLTKGLEFDTVILPHFDEAEKDRRVAYMMTTRALHRLYLLTAI